MARVIAESQAVTEMRMKKRELKHHKQTTNTQITFGQDVVVVVVASQFNGTSTPKESYSAKTGDNDWNVNSSRYSLRTAQCESIRHQAKSEQNVRQDLIPRVRHGEAALKHPLVKM